ncbi:N-acetyltransferase [Pantoea sp. 1.19]|uniref:GNAT family N-acetyltransferase n=1 Tax=Pantoea sp. 1.19 TaxID=1925589 RepID=UPI000948CDE7|nr:GNAT family N-acetyltransferase [Pantoea sp. 1.19]
MQLQQVNDLDDYPLALIALLTDSVEGGASVGFVPPLARDEIAHYWRGVAADLRAGGRALLLAQVEDELAGAVQLAWCGKANGRHRAEVEKLLVHRAFRRRGVGERLMRAAEQLARQHQRSLLVLDTRTGDTASRLYRRLGWQEAGCIPDYVSNAAGEMESTTLFYKRLAPADANGRGPRRG